MSAFPELVTDPGSVTLLDLFATMEKIGAGYSSITIYGKKRMPVSAAFLSSDVEITPILKEAFDVLTDDSITPKERRRRMQQILAQLDDFDRKVSE